MSDLNKWEKSFRTAAQHNEVLPPTMVWDKISIELDKKKKRRALIWFLSGLVAVGLTAGIYLLSDRKDVNNIVSNPTEKLIDPNVNKEIKLKASDQASVKSQDLVAEEKGKEEIKSVMLQVNPKSESAEINVKNGTQVAETEKNEKNKVGLQSGFYKRNSDKTKVSPSNDSKTITSKADPVSPAMQNPEGEDLMSQSKFTMEDYNSLEQLLSLESGDLDLKSFAIRPIIFPENVECYSFNKKRITPFLEIEGGMGYPIRHMTSNGEPSNLLVNRNNTEKPWYSYNASVRGGLILRNNMFIATGFNYTEVKEKFDLIKTGVTQIVINVNPITNQPIDTTIRTGTIVNSGENRYTMLNIPLSIGYQKSMRHWMISAEVGASYNIALKTSGKILYTDQNVHLLEDVEELYKKSTGISVNAALSLHYFIKDNVSVYVKPQYVRSMKDWTQPSSSISASYDILNFNIGVRRTF